MQAAACIPPLLALALSPLLLGVINRVKAFFAGRKGQPLLQVYFDLWKLLHKTPTYSRATTWVFRAGPIIGLAATLCALSMTPLGGLPAPLAFHGDLIAFALLLGVGRFMLIVAALDTGSAFEGMGASREAAFSALTEPALFLAFAAWVKCGDALSLTALAAAPNPAYWAAHGPALALALVTLFAVFLVENARIPIDDPNTHLELTMIHEVMVLDHSGPDFAFLQYAAALKHWILAALMVAMAAPTHTGLVWADAAIGLAGIAVVAIAVGVIESIMARLRLLRAPQLIIGATALAVVALLASGR